MASSDSTCWTLIRGAAEGRSTDREDFARLYKPVIHSYLRARWQGTRYLGELDDIAAVIGGPGVYLLNLSYEWFCTSAVAADPSGEPW